MDLLCEASFKQAVPHVVANIDRRHPHPRQQGGARQPKAARPPCCGCSRKRTGLPNGCYLTLTGRTPDEHSRLSRADCRHRRRQVEGRTEAGESRHPPAACRPGGSAAEAAGRPGARPGRRRPGPRATEAELRALLQAAQTSVSVLDFNEDRDPGLLIDTQLASVGWDVGPGRQSTAAVGKEVAVSGQPTPSGTGFAGLRPVRRSRRQPAGP